MGGILKHTTDRLVAHLFTALEADTSVKLFKVSEQDVSNVDRCLPSGLKTDIPSNCRNHASTNILSEVKLLLL